MAPSGLNAITAHHDMQPQCDLTMHLDLFTAAYNPHHRSARLFPFSSTRLKIDRFSTTPMPPPRSMPCSTHNPPTNHHSNYALRDGSRRAAARRMSRKGSRPKDTTVEKGLLGQWGWGAGAPLQSPPPTAVVDGSDGAVKPPTRSVSDSVLPPLAADPQPPLDQAPPPAKPAAHLRRQAEVKQKKPDPEVESRPPKREPPAVEPIEVDVYIMHAASAADDEATIALCKEIEAKAHRADDSLATAFLDIVSIAHLRIGDKKWRKKAEDERLARLRGAKSFAVLVTSAAVAELHSAHTTESVLLVCWHSPSPLQLRLIATRFLRIC